MRTDNAGVAGGLLARGFDPNSVDESGQPALTRALRDGALNICAALLEHPALQVDQANLAGETPLMMAALKGHAALATRLLARGASVNRAGWSPLHYAATGSAPAIVKQLIEHGAALDARSPNGTTPLMMAAQYGAEDSVRLLLAAKADPALRNDLGLKAADFARRAGREKLAAALGALQR
ncbi:MAG: ankyrin repeat domain-containing protein [Burkholderiaceae bacterium]